MTLKVYILLRKIDILGDRNELQPFCIALIAECFGGQILTDVFNEFVSSVDSFEDMSSGRFGTTL